MKTFNSKKIIKSFIKNIFLFILSFAVFNFPIFSEDWILAGETFSLKQSNSSESIKQVAEVLPQLILEQISSNKTRFIPESELLDRKINELQTERLSLFLQLENEVKIRDSLVITEKKPKKLEKEIIKANKKISEIQQKIEENLKKTDEEITSFSTTEKKMEETTKKSFFPIKFFRKDEKENIVTENVKLYKNDFKALFKPSEKIATLDRNSYEFAKEVLASKINGLLTGTIVMYGDYIGVNAEIIIYPGAKSIGTVSEVGMANDIVPLANRIIQNMAPKIANSLPILLDFEISSSNPDVSVSNPIVSIDGVIQNDISKPILIDSGIHTILVEAEGFDRAVLTYSFVGEEKFFVKAILIPSVTGIMNIRLKKFRDGFFYASAIDESKVDKTHLYSHLNVNGKDVLAVFEDFETHEKAFIFVPEKIAVDENNLFVNAKPFDRAKNIDKRRRGMYIAYSALMCSLPFTFYTLGEFDSANKAYSKGSVDYDYVKKWQDYSNITQGITFTFCAWFIVDLIRYLYAANRILPDNAKIDKKSEQIRQLEIQAIKEIELEQEIKESNIQENKDLEDSSENVKNSTE